MFDLLEDVGKLAHGLIVRDGDKTIECSDWLVAGTILTIAGTAIVLKDEIKEVVEKIVD